MTHVRTSPYYPQSSGKIESWHKTLKRDCLRPRTPLSLDDARRIVAHFVREYNEVRLHSGIGYGANGLPVGSLDESFDPPQPIESYRQLYASVDVDLTRIQTRSDFLRTLFNVFNFVKIPAPALEYRTNGSFRFHWIHF